MRVRYGEWSKLNRDAQGLWDAYRHDPCEENRNLLATHYYPLARFVAFNCWKTLKIDIQTDLEDLTSCASIALMDCIQRFDSKRGIAFTTWAAVRLHGAAIDHIREMDWVPRKERQAQKRGEVTPAAMTSLDARSGRQGRGERPQSHTEKNYHDAVPDRRKSERMVSINNREFFEEACKNLNHRDRVILIGYYQDELTMKEIGAALGLSESRVSQCHSDIIVRLKERWKNGRPSDRQPQSGRRGTRAHFENPGTVSSPQGRDGEGSGHQPSVSFNEAETIRRSKRETHHQGVPDPGNQGRAIPEKSRRRLGSPSDRDTDRRTGQGKSRKVPAKRGTVRQRRSRSVVPAKRKRK